MESQSISWNENIFVVNDFKYWFDYRDDLVDYRGHINNETNVYKFNITFEETAGKYRHINYGNFIDCTNAAKHALLIQWQYTNPNIYKLYRFVIQFLVLNPLLMDCENEFH